MPHRYMIFNWYLTCLLKLLKIHCTSTLINKKCRLLFFKKFPLLVYLFLRLFLLGTYLILLPCFPKNPTLLVYFLFLAYQFRNFCTPYFLKNFSAIKEIRVTQNSKLQWFFIQRVSHKICDSYITILPPFLAILLPFT